MVAGLWALWGYSVHESQMQTLQLEEKKLSIEQQRLSLAEKLQQPLVLDHSVSSQDLGGSAAFHTYLVHFSWSAKVLSPRGLTIDMVAERLSLGTLSKIEWKPPWVSVLNLPGNHGPIEWRRQYYADAFHRRQGTSGWPFKSDSQPEVIEGGSGTGEYRVGERTTQERVWVVRAAPETWIGCVVQVATNRGLRESDLYYIRSFSKLETSEEFQPARARPRPQN